MTDKTDVMRGEFEAWYRSRFTFDGKCYMDVSSLEPSIDGDYKDRVNDAWLGYQAALQSPAVRELVEALELAREELDGLPHSLGYDFTHIPKMDKALAYFASIKGDKP
jgi:hypothetical protein